MRATVREDAQRLRRAVRDGRVDPATFRRAIDALAVEERDAWLDVVWDLEVPLDDDPRLPRGCVPYLPCAVATLLEAFEAIRLRRDDVFVDVGAGPGRALAFAHLVTGATGIGVELQPTLIAAGRERAATLGLQGALRFVEGDAARLVRRMPNATVWFLYCPFDRARLDRFLGELETLAKDRPRRLVCVDLPPIQRPWLQPLPTRGPDLHAYQVVGT